MPGNRSAENGDFVTPRAEYREVSVVDAAGPDDAAIPVLDTRHRAVFTSGLTTPSFYGRNAQINLAAVFDGVTSATVQLWLLAEVEQAELLLPGGSSSSSAGPASEWIQVGADSALTSSALVVYKDIPPGQYKVLVTAIAGGGTLFLREQHAA